MKYNMAAPKRRLGLTKRNNYAPLHGNAHDSHSDSYASPAILDLDESLLKPPQEFDQESSISNSGASTPDNQGTESPASTLGWLEKESTKYFVQKGKSKRGATYGKGKKMANSAAIQKPRPPRNRTIGNAKFVAPAVTEFSEETLRKFENEGGFDRSLIPTKRIGKKTDDIEFEHFHRPVKQSKTGGRSEEDVFMAVPGLKETASTASMLGISSSRQSGISSQILDINNDIDDLMKRRAGKEASQDSYRDNVSKKRDDSPEPEFMAPSSSGLTKAVRPIGLDQLQDVEHSISHALLPLEEITCAECSRSICQTTMDQFLEKNHIQANTHLTSRQQHLLHKFHLKADKAEAETLWQERRYPDIDWTRLNERLAQHKSYIISVIDRSEPSFYVSRLQQEISYRGRRIGIQANERRSGEIDARNVGYYGTRGQRTIGDWLLAEFSTRLRQESKDHEGIKLADSTGGYVQEILIPEMVQQLIMEDLHDDGDMERQAQSRTEVVMSTPSADELCSLIGSTPVDNRRSLNGNVLQFEGKHQQWLARFVAWESAQCGLLLSDDHEA